MVVTDNYSARISTIEAELKQLLMKGGGRRVHELPSELSTLQNNIMMIRSMGYTHERMDRIEGAFSRIKDILS